MPVISQILFFFDSLNPMSRISSRRLRSRLVLVEAMLDLVLPPRQPYPGGLRNKYSQRGCLGHEVIRQSSDRNRRRVRDR